MEFWIARDRYGLFLFETEPYIENDMFTCAGELYRIDEDLFTAKNAVLWLFLKKICQLNYHIMWNSDQMANLHSPVQKNL